MTDRPHMLALVVRLASAADAVDKAFETLPNPWAPAVNDFAELARQRSHGALNAAILAALGSAVTIDEIETAIGRSIMKPEWFED